MLTAKIELYFVVNTYRISLQVAHLSLEKGANRGEDRAISARMFKTPVFLNKIDLSQTGHVLVATVVEKTHRVGPGAGAGRKTTEAASREKQSQPARIQFREAKVVKFRT